MVDHVISDAYRLAGITVDRAGRRVLQVDALDIPRGRVTVVAGPNGAGKTTLLRVLAFLQRPTAGTVVFGGTAVSFRPRDLTALRRRATLVAQAPFLFRNTVAANIAYGLRARGAPIDNAVERALRAVGLDGFAERPAWALSAGESQRVAIARALAIDPDVYLFDEPTASIDRDHVPVIESLIAGLAAAGKTVVLTTHSLQQAERLSTAFVSLLGGRVAAPATRNA